MDYLLKWQSQLFSETLFHFKPDISENMSINNFPAALKYFLSFAPYTVLHNIWGVNGFIKIRLACPICPAASYPGKLYRLLPFNHLFVLFVLTDNTQSKRVFRQWEVRMAGAQPMRGQAQGCLLTDLTGWIINYQFLNWASDLVSQWTNARSGKEGK